MVLSPQAMLRGFTMTKWIAASVVLMIGACTSAESTVDRVHVDAEEYEYLNETTDWTPRLEFYIPPYDDVLDYGFCPGEGWGGSPYVSPAFSGEYTYGGSSDKKITIDFVKKDIHTVMHFIALRTGLKIIIDGEIDPRIFLSVNYSEADPIDVIEAICKANRLILVRDGDFLIIKNRPPAKLDNVKPAGERRYNVSFVDMPLVEAIMETAKVTGTAAFVPAVPWEDDDPRPVAPQEITLTLKEATPDQVLRILAVLGELELEEDTANGYEFKYKINKEKK